VLPPGFAVLGSVLVFALRATEGELLHPALLIAEELVLMAVHVEIQFGDETLVLQMVFASEIRRGGDDLVTIDHDSGVESVAAVDLMAPFDRAVFELVGENMPTH